jgi:hypothetical protein
MTSVRRALAAVVTCLLLGMGLLTAVTSPASAAAPKVTLNSMGQKYVGTAIPVVGYLSGAGKGKHTTLKLQRKVSGTWHADGRLLRRGNGKFQFPARYVTTPQTARWRVVAKQHGKQVDVSKVLNVVVIATPPPAPTCENSPSPTTCPQPPDLVQTQDVVDPPVCLPLPGTVTTEHQTRSQPYVWNTVTLRWEPGTPLAWATTSTSVRAATQAECPSAPDLLPDLVVRNLAVCSQAERDKSTNDTCFRVEDFTTSEGDIVTLLKFPSTTINIGTGAMEIRSTRDNTQDGEASWHDTLSVQRVYNANDGYRDINITDKIDFYWEELSSGEDDHGHKHWHIFDFDSYTDNGNPDVQQKHGFCISSTGDPDPAYSDTQACGFNQPDTASIVHGMSSMYSDTYPSSLSDQGIAITDRVDGLHHVEVCADHNEALLEASEANNCASADVLVEDGEVVSVANGVGSNR